MRHSSLCVGLLALGLAGCWSVGPDYTEPTFPEADFSDVMRSGEQMAGGTQGPVTSESLAQWWGNLNDPILTGLMELGLDQNLDVEQARSRVRMSRLLLETSWSPFFPQIDGSGSASRKRISSNTLVKPKEYPLKEYAARLSHTINLNQTINMFRQDLEGALLRVPGVIASWPTKPEETDLESNMYRAGLDASWEIDIFGGTRRGVEAARADMQAAEESLNHVWVSLAGAIAQSYIELRTHQARLAVAESNLQAQTETYELLDSRYKAGLSDELALQQVRYVLESTRAAIPTLRGSIGTSMNSLAVLTGQMPGSLHEALATPHDIPKAGLKVVTGIPANAVRQRPDIRAAERQLAAQTARIGVAKAELFPKLSLTGSIGVESLKSSTLFNHGSDTWDFGPSVSWPIFHAGAIWKNVKVQDELQEQYRAAWENSVLSAVKEVRDALVDYAQEQERYNSLNEAVEAAQSALEVAQDQYDNGLSDFNNVLDAQRAVLSFQEQRAVSRGIISINLVRVYKALGGGWTSMAESQVGVGKVSMDPDAPAQAQ